MYAAFQVGNSQSMGPDVAKAKKAAFKIFSYIDVESRIDPMAEKGVAPGSFKEIQFKDVWFRYPAKKSHWVFKGLNLSVHKNESLAVVGESGAGKSTLVGLLLRFYDVTHGQILIDGVDIRELNVHQLRAKMGLVMQEPTLFNYSILENILYGKSQASNEEVQTAARTANATEFI